MVIYFSIYLVMTITCLSHHWGHYYQTPSGGSYIHQLGHGLGRAPCNQQNMWIWLWINSGRWLKNHLEKWWSSSMGRRTSYMKWKIKFMFETTNQFESLKINRLMSLLLRKQLWSTESRHVECRMDIIGISCWIRFFSSLDTLYFFLPAEAKR